MMIVMVVVMIATATIAWEYAAAQQDDHRCSKDQEQDSFHHEIRGLQS
ncbi:MAG TPA: hypothetical protein VGP21_03390 [Opitutaceae bacterium]|jgi:hypothetical protein|nr:hypothetical protein [Opitutaceae bacterium]